LKGADAMMILVTGGAGVMGRRLVRGLVEQGHRVRVLDRPGTRLDGEDAELVHGDVTDPRSLEGRFDGVDTVFHLAAILIAHDPAAFERVNVGGTRNVLAAARAAGVKHFIMVSSASVVYPETTAYSRSKRECERMVREQSDMQWTIIRPTLAYNEHGGEEFRMFLDYLRKYPVVPFIGRGRALKNPVHVDDLMRGFLAVVGNPVAYGKAYNFSGGEEISIWDLAHLMLKHQRISKPFVALPVPLCTKVARLLEGRMARPPLTWNVIAGITQDANLDNSEARRDLGYAPVGVREGLEQCFPLGGRVSAEPTVGTRA
jgi:nucleoside-diphosphate-sugar epimerase